MPSRGRWPRAVASLSFVDATFLGLSARSGHGAGRYRLLACGIRWRSVLVRGAEFLRLTGVTATGARRSSGTHQDGFRASSEKVSGYFGQSGGSR
jgi:hypothetical protein